MQALILAAGMGNRLRPLSAKIPKALVEVNGKPILFNALDILQHQGIKKTHIVLGYLGDVIKEKVGNNWKGMEINYIMNEEYARTNNIYSLWMAHEVLDEDTILMECDIYFEEALINRLLTQNLENRVVVDHFKAGMDGTVVEINDKGEIKRLITSEDQGINFDYSDKYKTVNIYLFTKDFLQKYFLPNLDLYIKTQSTNKYYELLLSVFISMRNPILYATVINDIKWLEIDDFSDLKKAEILFADPLVRLKKAESAHGGYWRYDFTDFSYLYNLYFPPVALLNDVRVNLDKLLTNYPSCQKELSKNLANWTGIESEYLTVGNGVSEIIRIINTHFIKKIAIPLPTFNEYESGLKSEQLFYFDTAPNDFNLNLEDYAKAIKKENCDVALLINPNNPTGKFSRIEEVKMFLETLKDLELIIVDESFIGFVSEEDQSLEKVFKNYPNLVIVHSLGKELGILGVRLGYVVSVNVKFNNLLRSYLPIWNVNSIAEYILEILPKYRKEHKESLIKVREDRKYLLKRLEEIPYFKVLNSETNYIFCILDGKIKSDELRDKLFVRDNILIKDCSNKRGLEDKKYIRIAVRTQSENDKLITCLKNIV
ncbi:MAG: aminotransferase class I/II-fold pyridoxal phosphate-dependent enzyme [Candidatus Magasanikbacteria bacterium]